MILRAVSGWTPSLLAVVLTLSLSSCKGGSSTATAPKLSETTWRIEEVGGSQVADPSRTELRINPDGHVSGSTGCNNFTGNATIEGTNLTFSPMATTRRACDGDLMDQERRMLDAMASVKTFSFGADGRLNLLGADGQSLLRLAKAK